ncbi:MAG: acyl-CoA dehydrogenase family protein [Porticoccaceae bacterium]
MNFSLTSEQKALIESAKIFAQDHIRPNYRLRDQQGEIHRPTLKKMGDMGFFGIELPENVGGLGQSCLTAGLVVESLCSDDLNLGYISITGSLLAQIMVNFGKPEVVNPWITGLLRGDYIPAIALTEPGGGSDAANLKLKAQRNGDYYVINGEKTSISMADQADFAIVFARTGTAEQRAKGISSFLVPLDSPGITRTTFDDHGTRSAGRGSLFFDDVRIHSSLLLGEENKGFSQVMAGFDYSRALLGILCLGVARLSLDAAWEYTKERFTFGKPLHEYQGVSFPLAEAETQLAGARLLCLQTLWLKDQGLPHTSEAAMCKWWGPKLAYDIVNTCLLTHGHSGYSKDMPFEQRLRDLLGLQIGDGTAQIMKMVIARESIKS